MGDNHIINLIEEFVSNLQLRSKREMIFIIIFFVIIIPVFVGMGIKRLKESVHPLEIIFGVLYFFACLLFALGMAVHNVPYNVATDLVDECYSPFSDKHIVTLLFYFSVFIISMLLVWTKNNSLPPLTLTLSLIFILIGGIISCSILFQVSVHEIEDSGGILFIFVPIFNILIGSWLVFGVILQEVNETVVRTYSNKYLSLINNFLQERSRKPIWIIVLLLPVFFVCTILLILFGQDANSIIKVFTDTTTWKFSQQSHPPILDHTGHYLCTVAAKGNPKIVKPLRFGLRGGNKIIVNRQLLVANAFEELIQDISPKLHFVIRKNYDKYGYNISRKINTIQLSNLTYILMKPLEWIFLICLYLFCNKPEQKINRQYSLIP